MTENSVIDLNDLVQSVKFKVYEDQFEIPPMNDTKIKKVREHSKKIQTLTDNEEVSPEQEDELLKTQNTILHECVSLNRNDKLSKIDKSDFALWPMRLKNKVLEMVFNQLGGGDTPTEEAEKN